jgi:hypothetical protein
MTIVASDAVFPNNIVSMMSSRFALLDPDLFVTNRPLRSTDPVQAVGVFASTWTPNPDSYEIRNAPIGPGEPTLQDYLITVHAYIKDMDQERGLATSSVLSKMLRTMLYHDEPLRIGLTSLQSRSNGTVETLKKWNIRTQRYNSNELQGNWLFLSTMDILAETETI